MLFVVIRFTRYIIKLALLTGVSIGFIGFAVNLRRIRVGLEVIGSYAVLQLVMLLIKYAD